MSATPPATPARGRVRVFRWQGIAPIIVLLALLLVGWMLLADPIMESTMEEAGTKALGAQLDIAGVNINTLRTKMEVRGVALADPFDPMRNLVEIGQLVIDVEPEPLLEKKVVVRQLSISGVRTGTRRSSPAKAVSGDGFAPRALREVERFASQFRVPLLSLTPIDTLRALVLDPTQLATVRAALGLSQRADSTRLALQSSVRNLAIQPAIDSSTALLSRLQGANIRTLGVSGVRNAASDIRRTVALVDSARARVETLVQDARRGVDSLQAGLRAIDDARRADYEFARGLLKLPSIETPDIGAALFGEVTIERFQQAVYWSLLARKYAPPGLLPRETDGPERLRKSGSTLHFVDREDYPRFLLRRADIRATTTGALGDATYIMAASNITTEPALVGQPTLFVIRRQSPGGRVDSLRITGSMDHLGARPREVVNATAAGVQLPSFNLPVLPLSMDPGRGMSELRFAFEGGQLSGRWVVRSSNLAWRTDSTRARALNAIEGLVSRVLTGIRELEVVAEVSGTVESPRLAVRSNLDRQIADRLRAVVGEEVQAAQNRIRAQVDSISEERLRPVRERIAELRTEGERVVADARARLDDEKRKLEERLRGLSAGVIGLPQE